MCGINGFNFKNETVLDEMNLSLKHRGPNNVGEKSFEKASLGHTRLSIIDLSKEANQPMNYAHKENNLSIVFNGEIYNFLELKKDLIKLGYEFKSNSDTEVILASYVEWGEKCVEKFNGMWAFCIYDLKKQQLFLSRDRLGQKPLYYYFNKGKFIFSSEIKAVIKHKIELEINPQAIDLYLSLGFIPAPYSIYKNIFKVEPSQNIIFNLKSKKISKKNYFAYPKYNPIYDMKKLKKEFFFLLKDSTKLRMISDVSLGAFLSGGIDSSIVVYQMKKLLKNKNLSTFSIEMKEASDSKYVDIMKNKLKLKNLKKTFEKKDFDKLLKNIYYYYDEPFADYSMFPTFYLSKITSGKLTVALSGDGADELFGGYEHYNSVAKIALLKKIPKTIRKMFLLSIPKNKKYFLIRQGILVSLQKPEDLISGAWEKVYKPEVFEKLSRKKMKEMLVLSKGDLVEAMMLYDRYFKTMGDNFLLKVDRASMANSLEVRSPFLDYRFIELASKIPSKWKADLFNTKIFLKRVIKNLLPNEVINRPKEGFNSTFLEKLIKQREKNENLEKIIEKLHHKKIISFEWKEFFLKKILNKNNGFYDKYKNRIILLYDWFNLWEKDIH